MNEKITGSVLNNELVAMSVLFRDGPEPYRTLKFTLSNGDFINIDVDVWGVPMGVEIVYGNFPQIADIRIGCIPKKEVLRRLLSASTRLSTINELKEALTQEVNDSLNVIRLGHLYEETGKYTTKIIRKQNGENK